MTTRQKDAATTHAKSSLKLISVSAVALLIGISVAAAQGGSARETEHDIEKKKDNELLTPIRPLPRKVGETSWPEPKPEAQREANERKAAPVRETTGQSMSAQSNKADQPNNTATNNPPNSAPQPAPNNQAATSQPQPAQANQAAQQPQQNSTAQQPAPATAQNNAKPQPAQANQATQQPQQNTAQAPQPSQNTVQNAPAPNNAQPNQQNAQQPAQQNNTQQAQSNAQQDHASIRLGTDASGKVSINEDQEQQLARALRRARPVEVNVGVQIGGRAPQGVRLAAVSADIVQVLPQFRGYSYFATTDQVYIVDPAANRVVAMVAVKLTATAKRDAPARTMVGSAPAQPTAQPEPNPAPAHTATVTTTTPNPAPATATVTTTAPEARGKRSTRRGEDLAGIEAAIEREVQRRGLRSETVVIQEAPAIQRVPTRRWRPWFAGDVQ